MSHVKNLQAFGKLTGICTGYGGTYKPGQQNLQVNALTTLSNNAQQVLMEFNESQTAYDNTTNSRELGFKDVRKLSSRIVSVLKSCGANRLTIDDARVSLRKLWGARKAKQATLPPTTQAANAPDEKPKVGTHGQGYASMEHHFAKLVNTVSAEMKYMPVEPELSVAGLQAKVNELHNLNSAVIQAEVNLTGARRKRDVLFYKDEGSLFATAVAVKNYVRGAFGFNSGQRMEVSRLHFDKPNG